MKNVNNKMLFGYWNGMPYGQVTDTFEEMRKYKNSINKDAVIKHIKSLDPLVACMASHDIFTGESITAGMYEDGPFCMPLDFLKYYEEYAIGIPKEYEEYLIRNGVK